MKKILFTGLFIFLLSSIHAQTYGNEWIKKDQKYFKIKVGKPGIYRIDYTSLITSAQQMNLDLPDINPKKFQMFYQGREIPIYVAGENDNVFNSSDFIEFYGQLNDGSLDSELYNAPGLQANKKVSMVTDTGYYYLTFLPSTSTQNGRHMQNYSFTNYAGFPELPYFMQETSVSYTSEYNYGKGVDYSGSEASNPEYLKAEGFCGTFFGSGTNYANFNTVIESRFLNSSGPLPVLSFTTVGNSEKKLVADDHWLKVHISNDNNSFTEIADIKFHGFNVINRTMTVDRSYVGANNTFVRFDAQFIAGIPYQSHAVNYVSLRYPKNFDLDGNTASRFEVAGSSNPRHIEWINYNANKSAPLAYDLTNGVRIRGEKYSGTKVRFFLPSAGQSGTECYIHDSTEMTFLVAKDISPAISYEVPQGSELELITFDPASMLHKNKLLLLTHNKFVGDYTSRYLDLRSSANYTSPCDLVTVQQLYDHFSYGVPHPIAIKRYLRYIKGNKDTTLKFLFLVGRGYQTNMLRNSNVANSNKLNLNMVPSIGVPASDNMFGTEILDSTFAPAVAIGRLTIDRPVDLGIYVNKLNDFETTSNQFWKKSVLHLAGGDNGTQADQITQKLNSAGFWVKNPPFGGKVVTYTKSSIGLSEPFLKEKAIENVNQGMQLLTFLGHGSAAVTDVDIGDTIEYNNDKKYPIFYFNGCSIGNPCLGPPDANIRLSGESFIKASRRGAIAFIAQSALSELYHVDFQIQEFYRLAFSEKYNGNYSIGEVVQDLLKVYAFNDEALRIQSRILFVQGDPSIRFFQPQVPDYDVVNNTPFLFPTNMTAVSDSFAIAVPIENRGKFINDSISIKVERSYPNNFMVNTHYFKMPAIGYKDTVYLYIKSKDAASAGFNKFIVTVNDDSKIYEPERSNNVKILDVYIPGNGINLIHPKRFDIVSRLNNDTVELTAQALNLFDKNYLFTFEIDTSYLFNSTWKKTDSSSSIVGQTKTWKVKLLGNRDSIVYYWRAKISTGSIQGGIYTDRSFIHIFNHEPGWSQSAFPQFYPSSKLFRIVLDKSAKRFGFTSIAESVYVNTSLDKRPNFGVKKNGHAATSLTPSSKPGIVAVLFDKNSLAQIKLPGIFNTSIYYGLNYYEDGTKAYNFNPASNDPQGGAPSFLRWIDSIPDSTYVALCNSDAYNPTQFTPAVRAAFAKLGANLINFVKTNNSSYAMIGQKGAAPGTAVEDTGYYYSSVDDQSYIEIQKELLGKRGEGTLSTELIGPTTKWGKLYFHNRSLDKTVGDNFVINVHGVTNGGQDSIILNSVATDNYDLSFINAKRFPNIYLEGVFEDLSNYTPSQIKHWRVTHAEVPEGTLNANLTTMNWKDILQQGEEFKYDIGFQNISKLTFAKGMKYQVLIYNVDTKDTVKNEIRYYADSLTPDKHFMIAATQSTKRMKGRYAYVIKVNFDNFNKSLFPELSMINNSSIRYFNVDEDLINPLLDVTFNGKHITNGEIVSANPNILISSKDENKLNWQTDSNGIKLWWKTPSSSVFQRIDYDSFDIKFYPATSAYNQAKAEFNPKNLPDGLYTLKVQSNDANQINAGSTEYMVNFTVINKASATNFYPYPNPFTSAMRFVFTLTGTEVPDFINVKIMTIQGKVVKELNKEDLGNINIGNNVTDVVWDGTDQYGDRLSNGVYLYTVTIKLHGEEVKQLENDNTSNLLNADKANNELFKHSTGKIVLLR
jgi:hypothetical protein